MFIVAGTNQVSARLPLQPSIIKIYVQSLASECLREWGPLYIHSSSPRGWPSIWRITKRKMESNTECQAEMETGDFWFFIHRGQCGFFCLLGRDQKIETKLGCENIMSQNTIVQLKQYRDFWGIHVCDIVCQVAITVFQAFKLEIKH